MHRTAFLPARHCFILAGLCLTGLASRLPAQVGHDPATSPYRDIRRSAFLVVSGGKFFGSGGAIGVAPHQGNVVGLRFSFLANRTIQLNAGGFYGMLERDVYDPTQPAGSRISGPIDNTVVWVEGGLQFNLTGGKSWNRFAPFAGASAGLAFSESLSDDPAFFKMGTKFVFAPVIGTRFFLSDRLALQLESRFNFWQIKYPGAFAQEGIQSSEWSVSPWVNLGLAWAISWPF